MIATGAAAGGLPLWAVCAITFVAILGVCLVLLLGPLGRRQRAARQARLDEVYRYRLLAAYADDVEYVPTTTRESAVTERALSVLDKAVRARGRREKLLDELERAGLRLRPEEWAAVQLLVPVVLLAVGALVGGVLGAVAGATLGWSGVRLFLRRKSSRRIALFEAQLPDALQLLGGALRTGFALNQAIGTVVREGTDPVSTEFGRAMQEVRIGASMEDALESLAARMKSYDLTLVVMAVRTAREVGGNLAEVLQTTVSTMRERVQLRGEVKTLSAEGRLSAKVLVGLPILMTSYFLLFQRDYIRALYTTALGAVLVVIGTVLLGLGTVWLNKLTKIEV